MQISKKLKKYWRDWLSARMINSFYRHESMEPAGERWTLIILLAGAAAVYAFLKAANFREALGYTFLILLILILYIIMARKTELQGLQARCMERLGDKEFTKRLDKALPGEVLGVIGQVLAQRFGVEELKAEKERLVGIYRGEKLAVYYSHQEDEEVLDTKNIMSLLRSCRKAGLKQVRIFTNTDFSPRAPYLGERYEVNLGLYNGLRLKTLLKETVFYPLPDEVGAMIKKESEKRQRKLSIIKQQAFTQDKTASYLIYGAMLLSMAWFGLGYVYLNLFFSCLLFLLAGISLKRKLRKKEEAIIFE